MAAARSPSRSPSRPTNLNPNTLESSGALRKSGTFNLSKSGGVSEISQRKFPSPRASFEQKENEKEVNCSKQERTRSNPSKGMKSFMAPTISASSKISATPRKKILAERNHVVRESTENNIVSTERVKEEIGRKYEIGSDSEEISAQSRSRKLDFSNSSKDHHHQVVITDPQDADPSLPPYDPMKNYLSPRPQFLHYKPNPRIEQHQELKEDFLYSDNARRLEDSFSDSEDSENCSGTVEDDAVPEEIHVSKSKPRLIGRFKLISFVLALTIVSFCIPLTDSPVLTLLKMNDQPFAGLQALPFLTALQDIHFYDYLDVAGRNLQRLSTGMKERSINSIEILTSLGYFSKELDIPHSFNMTISSSMVQNADLGFCYNSDLEFAEKENIVNGQIDGDDTDIQHTTDGEAATGNDIDVSEKINAEFSDASFDPFSFSEPVIAFETMNKNDESEKIESAISEEIDEEIYPEKVEEQVLAELGKDQSGPIIAFETMNKNDEFEKIEPAISEVIDEEIYPDEVKEQVLAELGKDQSGPIPQEDVDSSAYPAVESQISNFSNYEAVLLNLLSALQVFMASEKNLILAVAGIISTASLTFLLIKKRLSAPASVHKNTSTKTEAVDSAINGCGHAKGDLYCGQRGFMEMVSDSGPTEMSSSFNNINLSLSKQGRREKVHRRVTPSPEIMQRRDSGVSSSVSYGSFTSFEKCSSRKGFNEDEVVTPVRRSSRLRNLT